jgi:hypothetical protein
MIVLDWRRVDFLGVHDLGRRKYSLLLKPVLAQVEKLET